MLDKNWEQVGFMKYEEQDHVKQFFSSEWALILKDMPIHNLTMRF